MGIDNTLPVIQSLWIGGRLSVMERLCISSFLRNGHEFHLYTYNEVQDIPKGTIIKDASKVINADKIFKYKNHDSYSGFSNVFRYKLLRENGNYWVDTDVICLRPFDIESDYVFARARRVKLFGTLSETFRVQSCVIKTPQDSEIMDYCYEVSMSKNPQELEWGEIGPQMLRSAVKKFGLERYVLGPYAFCPIDWHSWERCIDASRIIAWLEKAKMFIFSARAIHLWHEMWRKHGIDKNQTFPETCLYEQLKKRYIQT